jgi:hypothetical protein
MQISWVFSADYQLPPEIDIEIVKNIGPIWGSWRTWRSSATDNVICHDRAQAETLVTRQFQNRANLYLPQEWYSELGYPQNVNWYNGNYAVEMNNIDDCIAMHLAAVNYDVILLLGFDLTLPQKTNDRAQLHRDQNRHSVIYQTVKTNNRVQWVVVDGNLDKHYSQLSNITCDKLQNVLQLLS